MHHLCASASSMLGGGGWRPPDSILSWVCATLDGDSLSQGGCPLSRGAQAARIQARYRGRALRREQRQALEAESAARVQAAYRGVRTRKDVGSLRALRPAAIKVQVGVTHSAPAQHACEAARPNGGRPNARTVPRGERQRLAHSLTPRARACMACGLWPVAPGGGRLGCGRRRTRVAGERAARGRSSSRSTPPSARSPPRSVAATTAAVPRSVVRVPSSRHPDTSISERSPQSAALHRGPCS
eukprot:SAG25_NODE_148_length_13769_cov_14.642648_5_plen_242_part_00